ncbi:GATA transcription factor 9-like [Rutidosis leptorrhynchoides]|uniref:GATA transcription factor 9-like n=1 Tax=Rutidosis leptorrhynchoides TaxID=125765 RepID=UPI003A9948E5
MEAFEQSTHCHHHVNDNQQITPPKNHLLADSKSDHFVVDDLLVFPTDNVTVGDDDAYVADMSTESSAALDSCNSFATGDEFCQSFLDNTQLPNLFVPHDDIAEFEWMSNFMEESLSTEDLQKLQLISGIKTPSKYSYETIKGTNNDLMFNVDITIPGKARTKRSRAVSCNWASQLLVKSPIAEMTSNSDPNIAQNSIGKKRMKTKEFDDKSNDDGRKCLHCATDKTPQWRSGPMGPKTLCNACGVRYKSGRLVPEYRPAASPTFVLTKHSNSHRKVLELQLQKSQHYQQQQQLLNHQNVIMLRTPNDHDYSIHQRTSNDYPQLI